ncbi:MAG: DMT family transporter [Burkholderiaceae bacterium]|nr:DMT family transporter [Burkholderiaceae bacterium]
MTALHNRRGVIAMSAGMVCFVLNDTLVKFVSDDLPASQLIFLRGVLAVLGLLLLVYATDRRQFSRAGLLHMVDKWVVLRSMLDGVASLVYLSALFHMPLGNATAINMSTPLLIALLSGLLMGVHVSARNWLIIGLGFVGVLMVVQPQADGFNAWAWVALAGTVLHALRDLSMRFIAPEVPSMVITVGTALAATVLSGVWSIFTPWQAVSATHWGMMAAAAVFLSCGYFFLIKATRMADMSVVAPFRYIGLLTAVLAGYVIWDDMPNPLAWCGMLLLVGAGILMLRLHRQPDYVSEH